MVPSPGTHLAQAPKVVESRALVFRLGYDARNLDVDHVRVQLLLSCRPEDQGIQGGGVALAPDLSSGWGFRVTGCVYRRCGTKKMWWVSKSGEWVGK